MKKKNLSFMSLLTLSVALLGGCGGSDKNVSDIVLKVGDKEYTVEQVYNRLLSTGTGANEAFSIVLRLVVESSMETTANIQTAADMAEETFEEEVEVYAQNNGVRVKDARKTLLEEKGYESVEEMKADIIYQQKLTRLNEQYWETHKGEFYDDYVENRLPYLVSHVLVKLDDNTNGNKIANNVNVSQAEAEKIHDVINRFKNGDEFSYVANHFSDDSGSTASGGAYYMDTTTSFVDEFLYGTYLFDAYTEKVETTTGGTTTTYYKWGRTDKYQTLVDVGFVAEAEAANDDIAKYYEDGLNVVPMEIVEKLGDVANKTSTGDFHYIGYVGSEDYVSTSGVTEYDSNLNNLNSNYNAYARSIIFNRAFNKPGLSVIGGYESKDAAEADGVKNCVEIRTYAEDGQTFSSNWVLADENGNPIFFVAAKGSSNDVWLHFLTINKSSLSDLEDAKKYFSIDPSAEDGYVSYAEDPAFNVDATNASKKKLISEIEGYVKSYITSGEGSTVGEESLLSFKMLEDYMATNKIEWSNDKLKEAIASYISRRRDLLNQKHNNKLLESFDKHTNKLITSESELVQMGIKPYECAVVLESDAYAPINNSTSTGNLCRYVYGKGYQVKLSYYYHTDLISTGTSYTKITTSTDVVSFHKNEAIAGGFDQWAYIGEVVTLPTVGTEPGDMKLKTGYKFEGWYTTKDFKPESRVEVADLSETSIKNHTIFYAKIVPEEGTYQVKYTYKYLDDEGKVTDVVASSSLVTKQDITQAAYSATGGASNTYTLDIANFASGAFTFEGFDVDGEIEDTYTFTLDGTDLSKGIEVVVYVTPVETTFYYEFIDENGDELYDEGAEKTTAPAGQTYNPAEAAENTVVIDKAGFSTDDGLEVKEIKFARTEQEEPATSFVLTETDCGGTIIVYVVVGSATTGE